jgi:KUP system potassium uptake protein
MAPILFVDLTFLSANLLKVFDGGWMPLALGAVVMTIIVTRGGAYSGPSPQWTRRHRNTDSIARYRAWRRMRRHQRYQAQRLFLTGDSDQRAPTAFAASVSSTTQFCTCET